MQKFLIFIFKEIGDSTRKFFGNQTSINTYGYNLWNQLNKPLGLFKNSISTLLRMSDTIYMLTTRNA